ncbi:hypothetical protein [Parenemella sanctibonifatiensis]|uniref:Uncharacterized protein n=1 Tax=Parenemella sanctibonifatiensis TaxID=2016505 RepID=A0A255E7I2_9ACTN|nr:hypothetical protein [Parenemella sanctibonifatiensis]OYN87509.1 hypothetical protein CGZ92_07285 [Parenemella sanctibonifatiensis]
MTRHLIMPPDFLDFCWELEYKGYFSVEVVLPSDRIVPVEFYDHARLAQELREHRDAGTPFFARRIAVVESVDLELMNAAVRSAPDEFFE